LDIEDADHRKQAAHRIIAKMPTLAAMVYKHGVVRVLSRKLGYRRC